MRKKTNRYVLKLQWLALLFRSNQHYFSLNEITTSIMCSIVFIGTKTPSNQNQNASQFKTRLLQKIVESAEKSLVKVKPYIKLTGLKAQASQPE